MLDIISMTTLLMITFILGLITFLILCIIVGGNSNKTEYERKMEDEEQMKYLENYKNKQIKNRQKWFVYFFRKDLKMNNKNKYSPKETLGLLILANKNVTFKELDNLILSLEQILLQRKPKKEILEQINVSLISKIENYL